MASASTSTAPPLKAHDVVVPIVDASVDAELRAKNGYDRSRGLTTTAKEKEENPSVWSQNSFHLSQSSMQSNLWREVSSDYLQGLELSTEDSDIEITRRKGHNKSRPQSFDFGVSLDPPTKLIENFLQHQAATGNLCLDMDMNMIEKFPTTTIAKDVSLLQTVAELPDKAVQNPKVNEVFAHPSTNSTLLGDDRFKGQQVTQQHTCVVPGRLDPPLVSKDDLNLKKNTPKSNRESLHDDDRDDAHSSSDDEATIRHMSARSSLNRIQTRSRLADRPSSTTQMDSPASYLKSGLMRSGGLQKSKMLGKSDEDEDDPFKDADIPKSLRRNKCGFSTILQWIAFILIMGWLVCSLTIPALVNRPLLSMALWKWAFLTFLLFCGRLVSGWVIRILVIIIERNFLLRKRVLYFVYGLRKGVQNCLWFALAVLAWRLVFDPKVESATKSKVLPYVTKVLNCLLIAAIVWLVKIFFVKVLASSFHVSTYFDRIRESLFGQWVLETLAGPPAIEMEQETKLIEELNVLKNAGAKGPEAVMPKTNAQAGKSGMIGLGVSGLLVGGKKSGMIGTGKSGFMGKGGFSRLTSQNSIDKRTTQNEGITIDDLHRLNQRNISAWNMKRLMNFVRYRGIYTLVHVIDQTAAESQGDAQEMAIDSEWQAKAVAKKIFKNVAKPGSSYIARDDLLRFMLEPEVERALPLFEGAEETGKISKNSLKDFAVHVVRERRALSLSLNDTKTAVKKLHRIVDVIVGLIILVVFLLVLGLTTTHLLVVISSQLVLVVFIFGNTCKNVFEAIVFLFVLHPFDVGDRCVVDGNQLVVEEMNILSTLFVRNDGETIWYPNSLLATKYIFNYHRTSDVGDSFDFCIDASTPSDQIHALKDKIAKYIASNPNHWTRDFNLIVQSIEDNNKMNMQLKVNHTINFNKDLERTIRKSELILEVKKMLQELDLGYRLLPQEVHLASPSIHKQNEGTSHPKAS